MKKFGLGNRITPYKNRNVKLDQPVFVYRCLRGKAINYSIKQDGLVVGHTDCLMIRDCEFIVNESGRLRVIKDKEKNVHAFIKGIIVKQGGMGMTAEDCEKRDVCLPAKITYNPYTDTHFTCKNLTTESFRVKSAWFVTINKKGVMATYTVKQ